MVSMENHDETDRLYQLLGTVTDPEIPVLTLADLGVHAGHASGY